MIREQQITWMLTIRFAAGGRASRPVVAFTHPHITAPGVK